MIKVCISLTCEIHINLHISREFFKVSLHFIMEVTLLKCDNLLSDKHALIFRS